MSIEIAENSEIDYGKNIGLAWPAIFYSHHFNFETKMRFLWGEP